MKWQNSIRFDILWRYTCRNHAWFLAFQSNANALHFQLAYLVLCYPLGPVRAPLILVSTRMRFACFLFSSSNANKIFVMVFFETVCLTNDPNKQLPLLHFSHIFTPLAKKSSHQKIGFMNLANSYKSFQNASKTNSHGELKENACPFKCVLGLYTMSPLK